MPSRRHQCRGTARSITGMPKHLCAAIARRFCGGERRRGIKLRDAETFGSSSLRATNQHEVAPSPRPRSCCAPTKHTPATHRSHAGAAGSAVTPKTDASKPASAATTEAAVLRARFADGRVHRSVMGSGVDPDTILQLDQLGAISDHTCGHRVAQLVLLACVCARAPTAEGGAERAADGALSADHLSFLAAVFRGAVRVVVLESPARRPGHAAGCWCHAVRRKLGAGHSVGDSGGDRGGDEAGERCDGFLVSAFAAPDGLADAPVLTCTPFRPSRSRAGGAAARNGAGEGGGAWSKGGWEAVGRRPAALGFKGDELVPEAQAVAEAGDGASHGQDVPPTPCTVMGPRNATLGAGAAGGAPRQRAPRGASFGAAGGNDLRLVRPRRAVRRPVRRLSGPLP